MTRRFAQPVTDEHLARATEATVAWLTGQSSRTSSTLSPAQQAVLDDVAAHGFHPVPGGLPYDAAQAAGPYRKPALLPASARNGRQYLAARTSRRFGADVARHLQPLLDATRADLLLLCGSCGVELLAAAQRHLVVPPSLRVHVVALGPVGRLPHVGSVTTLHVVRGSGDSLSRWTSRRGRDDVTVPGGHLDYATSAPARAEVLRVAAAIRAGRGAQR